MIVMMKKDTAVGLAVAAAAEALATVHRILLPRTFPHLAAAAAAAAEAAALAVSVRQPQQGCCIRDSHAASGGTGEERREVDTEAEQEDTEAEQEDTAAVTVAVARRWG